MTRLFVEEIIIEIGNRYLDYYEYENLEGISDLGQINEDKITSLKQSMALLSAYKQNIISHIPKIIDAIRSDLVEMQTPNVLEVEFFFKEKAEDEVPPEQIVVDGRNKYSICVSSSVLDSLSIIESLRLNILLDFERIPTVSINVSHYINEKLKCNRTAVKDLWDHILRTKETVR
jgi:hypothetical protein